MDSQDGRDVCTYIGWLDFTVTVKFPLRLFSSFFVHYYFCYVQCSCCLIFEDGSSNLPTHPAQILGLDQ